MSPAAEVPIRAADQALVAVRIVLWSSELLVVPEPDNDSDAHPSPSGTSRCSRSVLQRWEERGSSAWMSAVRLITHDSGLDSLRSSRPTSWGELELGPPVWTGEHDFTRAGEPVRQFETMLLAKESSSGTRGRSHGGACRGRNPNVALVVAGRAGELPGKRCGLRVFSRNFDSRVRPPNPIDVPLHRPSSRCA